MHIVFMKLFKENDYNKMEEYCVSIERNPLTQEEILYFCTSIQNLSQDQLLCLERDLELNSFTNSLKILNRLVREEQERRIDLLVYSTILFILVSGMIIFLTLS